MATIEIKGSGSLTEEHISVAIDAGFMTVSLEVERSAFADDDKIEVLEAILGSLDEKFAEIMEAMAAEAASIEEGRA